MFIHTNEGLQDAIKKVRQSASDFADEVQDVLLTCAYYAFKDGNTTPFDQLISAVGNGTDVNGITRWIELVSGIGRVHNGKIVLNKKVRDMSGVIDEESFEPFYVEMSQIMWLETAGKKKPTSVFDEGVYLKNVCNKLVKNGWAGLAHELKQAELAYLVKLHAAEAQAENEVAAA